MTITKPNLLTKALLLYSGRFPNHRGKWRLIQRTIDSFGIHLEGTFTERRAGSTWKLTPADYTHHDLFWYGTKDRWEMHHLSKFVSSGSVFIDAGASFGFYAVQIAKRVGPAGRVYAFEPNPDTYKLLTENLALNGINRATAVECALGGTEGRGALATRPDNSGASTVVEGDSIALTTLDSFAAKHSLKRLDAIKIDVEGFEERMLTGAAATLRKLAPVIFIEVNPPALAKTGSSPQRVVDLLRSFGYEVFEIHRERLTPLGGLPSGEDYINVLAIPHDHSAEAA